MSIDEITRQLVQRILQLLGQTGTSSGVPFRGGNEDASECVSNGDCDCFGWLEPQGDNAVALGGE